MFVVAIETKFVEGDPFQTHKSPQINASAIFHPRTAVGKLNAVIIPTILYNLSYILPQRIPLFFHKMMLSF